ncbi:capsule biosynthesis protein [Frigidibacter sp. MR17.24]|uniref:capsule biosynthesis protein n=1 Tax=Frigidibacter sp. MR17.24 TaxID=3127345 RepID=UPI003012C97F
MKEQRIQPPAEPAPAPRAPPVSAPAVPPRPAGSLSRLRHRIVALSFALVVVIPGLACTLYLTLWAAEQYHAEAAFSVRSTESGSAFSALAAFTHLSGSSVPDGAVLYDYIRSAELMREVDAEIGLDTVFNRAPRDIVFSLRRDRSLEDKLDYWNRMVRVDLDTTTNILYLRVLSFAPEDSVAIARSVIRHSDALVNHLNVQMQMDATVYAEQDLRDAEEALDRLRVTIQAFRDDNRIIDPESTVASQIGVLSALQAELAQALVDKATITPTVTGATDPRLENIDRRAAAIRQQIDQEQARVNSPTGGAPPLSRVMGRYEELRVDLNFAQQAYTTAMAQLQVARAEARRQTRYLATHVRPSLAQDGLYPGRFLLSAVCVLGLFAVWAVAVLVFYNIRDRR